VIDRVRCELKDFFSDHNQDKIREGAGLKRGEKLVFPYVDEKHPADAVLELGLKTDETGSVAWTGIDLKKLGLSSLADLIAQKTPGKDITPLLNASIAGNYVKTVAISILLDQTKMTAADAKCQSLMATLNPLFIEDWLNNFLIDVNKSRQIINDPVINDPKKTVSQPRLEFVSLQTEFHIVVDVSAGINSVILLPTHNTAPTLDFKPNFSHTLKLTLNFSKKNSVAANIMNAYLRMNRRDLLNDRNLFNN
jgi:hypothetical protein